MSVSYKPDIDKFVEIKYEHVDFGNDLSEIDPNTIIIPPHIEHRTYERAFRTKLRKAGLSQLSVDVVTLRFVYEMNLRDIAEELGLTSLQVTHNILQKALKHLRKQGWGEK